MPTRAFTKILDDLETWKTLVLLESTKSEHDDLEINDLDLIIKIHESGVIEEVDGEPTYLDLTNHLFPERNMGAYMQVIWIYC